MIENGAVADEAPLDGPLEEAVQALGIADKVGNLRDAAEYSRGIIADGRASLRASVPPDGLPLDVVVVGSLARQEAQTGQSDLDYLVVAYQLPEPDKVDKTKELFAAAEEFRKVVELQKEGGTGTFAQVVAAPELTERIGLQHDTNISHTHRLLLLEESASIYQPQLREQLLKAVLARYLIDYKPAKQGVPRFLFNDVERYWRTLCVDYQAKRWGLRTPEGWGLRYLKLIVSRKLAFAGTVTSLLLCEEATTEALFPQFEITPLSRLAQLHEQLEGEPRDSLRESLLIADEFLGLLGQGKFREEAKSVLEPNDFKEDSRFALMKARARELQGHLEKIFYDSILEPKSRTYLSF